MHAIPVGLCPVLELPLLLDPTLELQRQFKCTEGRTTGLALLAWDLKNSHLLLFMKRLGLPGLMQARGV